MDFEPVKVQASSTILKTSGVSDNKILGLFAYKIDIIIN